MSRLHPRVNRSHKVRVSVERGRGSPCTPSTLLAHSNTAIWNPRQMPKNGIFCSRAHLIARIIPSVPRCPKPPGTRIPLGQRSQRSLSDNKKTYPAPTTLRHASWYLAGSDICVWGSRSEDSTHYTSSNQYIIIQSERFDEPEW